MNFIDDAIRKWRKKFLHVLLRIRNNRGTERMRSSTDVETAESTAEEWRRGTLESEKLRGPGG